jgi:hypothetical protein
MKAMKVKYLLILLLSAGFCLLFAADDIYNTSVSIDWAKGWLKISAATAIDLDDLPFPKARARAEQVLYDSMPSLFVDALMDIPIDSYYTVREKLKDQYERENLLQTLSRIASKGNKMGSSVSEDFKYLETSYVYPFYGPDGIVSTMVRHSEPVPLRQVIGFYATRKFSGVVIYAKGEYPVWGANNNTRHRIQKAFFPKIYDDHMNIVLREDMCDPRMLKEWGVVAYTSSDSSGLFGYRVGAFPLDIIARGVYGRHNTDIIISSEDAGRLLGLEHNRQLLVQGKILVIIDK